MSPILQLPLKNAQMTFNDIHMASFKLPHKHSQAPRYLSFAV